MTCAVTDCIASLDEQTAADSATLLEVITPQTEDLRPPATGLRQLHRGEVIDE
jgi:hypothetical protein